VPTATIDPASAAGSAIDIEVRDPEEITSDGFDAHNLAFDMTPARLVSAIVTEQGIARAPYARSLASHLRRATTS
jgi:methylthioribose-1-phosphate isomerase